MDNSKFGLSIELIGFVCYIMSGYMLWVGVLIMMLILLHETSTEIQINSIQAVIIGILFLLIGWAWDILVDITTVVNIISLVEISQNFHCLLNAVKIITILFLGACSLSNNKAVKIPYITSFVKENFKL
jgi:hypothetical protein